MGRHGHSIDGTIMKRIQSHGRGWVFTPNHFDDLAVKSTVTTILKRHTDRGAIRNLARGLYDYPREDSQFGKLLPSNDAIVKALVERGGIRVQPSGAYAANLLGLSTQVPMKAVYLTDGRSKVIQIGKREIQLRKTTPKSMAAAGKVSVLVIQALKHIGKDQVDDEIIAKLHSRLDVEARKQLIKDIRSAPAWIADIIRNLAATQS